MQRRVVKKQAVSFLSVLAETFAVIAGHYDDGVVVDAGFFQKCNPAGDRGIGIGNFTVVQMVLVFFRERRRRFVRIVWIVQVHPNEVGAGAVLVEPGFGVRDDFHPAALDASPALFSFSLGGKVIVEIEAAIEAGSERVAVENHGSDESRGLVAALFQQLRRSHMLRRERDGKIGDAVHARQEAGQNRNVRSVRDRAMSERLREANTIGGDGVEGGGFDLLVPVAAKMIGAQRINRNEVHVGERGSWRGLPARRLAPDRGAQQHDANKYWDENHPRGNGQPWHKRPAYHNLSAEFGLYQRPRSRLSRDNMR